MDGLLLLFIIAAVVLYRIGPKKRADLKRQIGRSFTGAVPRSTGRRSPRRSSLPPPSNPQPPPPTSLLPPPPESIEQIATDPAPSPLEPVVIEVSEPTPGPEVEPEPDPQPEPATAPAGAPGADLTKAAVVAALFFDQRNAQDRLDAFEHTYAGHEVEWTAEVVRTSNSRRDGEAALRAELFLGYASENEFHSNRVLAEAYFGPDVQLERDATITFRGTLADANVFARRVVLDGARLV